MEKFNLIKGLIMIIFRSVVEKFDIVCGVLYCVGLNEKVLVVISSFLV